MPIVSITKASKLSGKSVRTIQRHLSNGKLSFVMTPNDTKGIDISELIRAYGHIASNDDTQTMTRHDACQNIPNDTPNNEPFKYQIELLKLELEAEKKLSNERLQTIDTLKTALKLLEHRQEKTEVIPPKETQTTSKPPQNTPTDPIEPLTPSTGFWGGLKKLFR